MADERTTENREIQPAQRAVAGRRRRARIASGVKKPTGVLRKTGSQAGKQTGSVVGSRAVRRATDSRRVIEAIERTHTRQVGQAASKEKAIKETARKVKTAADRAAVDGGRAGGMEQLKGHFIEILDVDTYNAKNKLTGKKLVQLPKATNEAYDAKRIIVNKQTSKPGFAGGVQQKASASHVKKTIKAMEKKKPGSAKNGVLRVPKDQVETARRRAGGRVKEVKGMEFTRQEATKRLETGVSDIATKGTRAASRARALGKAGATGAAVSAVIGGLTDVPALHRGDITRRDYAENRVLDAGEGATGAVLGTAVGGMGVATATAALGTATGASLAASAGAAGTALVTAIGGMGSIGAGAAAVLGGVTATAALPAVAGAGAAIGTGMVAGKGFKYVRRTVEKRQRLRRELNASKSALELTEGSSAPVVDATAVELTLRGGADFTADEAQIIRDCLVAMAGDPSITTKTTARLRQVGFYVSDWTQRGRRLTVVRFDELVSAGLISVQAAS